MARPLSERQSRMLRYIRDYLDEHGYPPSIREIGQAVQISSTSVVSYNLNALVNKGVLTRNDKVSRGLRLADDIENASAEHTPAFSGSDLFEVPLLGTIGAGTHIQPRDNDWLEPALGHIALSADLGADRDKVYALRVEGDSMIDALIAEGDVVVMQHQETANNGDFVAAWLKRQEIMTLKEFHRESDKKRIRLQPYNPNMAPIYVDSEDDIEIQGKVIAVLRHLA